MIPVVDMCSGTAELSAATQGTLLASTGLAGNAVVGSQASLMLARALTQLNSTI